MKFKFISLLTLLLMSFNANAGDYTPTVYGFVKASAVVSDHAVESYGRPNSVAYTAAGNPALSMHPSRATNSFQVQQSRFGLKTTNEDKINGLLEFDFVDFSKSTPAVASVIRLRRATINFKQDDWTFNIGQDWDLVSPLTPYSYNFIGHYFGAGDLGFMRLQAQALKKSGDFEHAVAIGFPSYNNQTAQSTPEYSMSPTLALRETVTLDKHTLGASGLVGHIEDSVTEKTLTPYVLNLFWKYETDKTQISSEAYYGQNLDQIGMYGLGYSPSFKKLEEMGGFITVRRHLNEKHGIFGGLGYARVSNWNAITPSYSYTGTPSKANLNLTGANSTGYGIAQNATVRLGYEYSYSTKMNFFAETAFLYTQHVLDPLDQNRLPSYNHAQVFEIGLKLDI